MAVNILNIGEVVLAEDELVHCLEGRHYLEERFPGEASVDKDEAAQIGEEVDVLQRNGLVSAD